MLIHRPKRKRTKKTVREWLEKNNLFTEATMLNANGKEVGVWYGDDDPKYKAKVLRVEAKGDLALLYTDWQEKGERHV